MTRTLSATSMAGGMKSAMEPALEVVNVSKHFILHQQGGTRIDAVEGISFQVFPGECAALHGPSGAGKSTLLKSLYGNYLPTGGSIFVRCPEGVVDIASADPRTVSRLRRTCISYVSQFLRVIPRVSTLELVAEPLLMAGVGQKRAYTRASEMLERLNLPARLWNLAPATFSGGEQQRVNIARGLIRPTPILLLDEPTASLDAVNRGVVVGLIKDACRASCAVVGIFHDDETRSRVATKLISMTRPEDHQDPSPSAKSA